MALPVQMPSPMEMKSHDGETDGLGQFREFPSSMARAARASPAISSPVIVPDAVQNRSEFQPPPCVARAPLKRSPSCAVIVNEPVQPPQFWVVPVSRLRNTLVPDTRHRPVKVGNAWVTTPGAANIAGARLIGDGPAGMSVTPLQAQDNEA